MKPFQPKLILVPTDFSEPAAHALRYASALGERFDAHLLVLYADSFMPPVDLAATTAGQFAINREEMIEEAREQLQAHAEENIGTNVPYDARVVVESPVNAIIEQACDTGSDLIVMGTHGRTGVRRLLFGSVTEAVIRLATTPVIAINSSAKESAAVRKVLCPVAFTDASREALCYASVLAEGRETPLVLFRGIEEEELQSTIGELIKLQEWAPRELVDRCELKILPTRAPAEQIVEFAKLTDIDLIALGVSGDRKLADVLRGSVVERIVQHSKCPVLMVNEATARRIAPVREAELVAAATP